MKPYSRILFAAALAAAIALPGVSSGAGSPFAGHGKRGASGPTKITSDRLEFDYHNFVALFDGHVDVSFFYNVQLLVFEEVADKTAAAHAEGVEAVGGLPRTDGEGKTDTGSVDILDLRVADSRGLRHGSRGECWSHNGCKRSDDEAVAVDDGFMG